MPSSRTLALLCCCALALIELAGCASEAPSLVEEPGYSPATPAALVVITPQGLEPPALGLRREATVLFLNATGADLVSISVAGWGAPFVASADSEGFHARGELAVTDPPLAPGAAAALSVPAGAELTYEVSGPGLWRGRIRREEP